jgi:hypothetical protein
MIPEICSQDLPELDPGGEVARELRGIDGQPIGPAGAAVAVDGLSNQQEVPAPCQDASNDGDKQFSGVRWCAITNRTART